MKKQHNFFLLQKNAISRKQGEGEILTQDEVREKLIEKTKGMKIKFIAEELGIPREILSKFKNGRRDLYPESLERLNNYLNNSQINFLCKSQK